MIECPNINIVVLANQLNLSIFQQYWLIENQIVNKEDFGPESYSNPIAVSVNNSEYELLILPDRIQLTLKSNIGNSQELVNKVISGIVNTLPHTPFTAFGFNFNFIIKPKNHEKFYQLTKALCLTDINPLKEDFSENDARYGFYLSHNVGDIRVKIDIKPIVQDDKREAIMVIANCHKDISKKDEVNEGLTHWQTLLDNVSDLVGKLDRYIDNDA